MPEPMTPEQFQKYLDEQAELLDKNIISQQQYDDAVKDATVGLKGYTEQLRNSTKQLKNSLLDLGSSIVKGEEGASVYNKQINSGADVLSSFLQKFGLIGKLLGFLVTATAKYVTAVNEQADALFKSYKELSRNGLALGMDDSFKNLQKLGYTAAEIGNMSSLLKENATLLANFGGTAAQGTKAFADVAHGIQYSNIGYQFRLMGMNTDAVNKGIAGYMKTQLMAGNLGKQSNDQIRNSAEAYILQQDKMTKLTGLNADQQQSILDQAMANERFAAKQAQLLAKGDAQSMAEYQRNIDMLQYFTAKGGPKLGAAYQNFTSGFLNSDGAKKFNFQFGSFADKFNKGVTDNQTLINSANADAKLAASQFNTAARLGMSGNALVDYVETQKLASNAASDFTKNAVASAEDQQNFQRSGQDKATKNLVDITTRQRNMTQTTDALTNKGIVPVTKGMAGLSSGLEAATSVLDKISGREETVGGERKTAPVGGTAPAVAPPNQNQQQNLNLVSESAKESGLTDTKLIRALQANVLKESGAKTQDENLAGYANTSNDRIRKNFGDRVAKYSDAELNALKRNPQKLAEILYGSKSGAGLGNNTPGDGWLFRGRGFIQLTGRANYASASQAIFGDSRLVDNPDLVNDPKVAAQVAAWFVQRDKGRMASILGINTANMSQEQANTLVSSIIAGGDIRKKGAFGNEVQQKVAGYEKSLPTRSAANGGILSGPKSGYQATLHGNEAVVPLPDGRSIPVEMRNNTRGSREQMTLLYTEVSKLENLVRIMEKQNNLATKMYQRSK